MTKMVSATIKSGPYKGTKYPAAVRVSWGKKYFSLDARAPWRATCAAARIDAEALGWSYVRQADGSFAFLEPGWNLPKR